MHARVVLGVGKGVLFREVSSIQECPLHTLSLPPSLSLSLPPPPSLSLSLSLSKDVMPVAIDVTSAAAQKCQSDVVTMTTTFSMLSESIKILFYFQNICGRDHCEIDINILRN